MSSVILDAEARLSRRGKERLLLWSTSLKTAIYDDDFLEAHAADLVALVVETLSLYHDSRSARAVCSFIRSAIKSPAFLKSLAAAIVKLAPGAAPGAAAAAAAAPARLSQQQAYSLLCWSGIALEQLRPETAKKAVSKLVEIQCSLLETLAVGSARGGSMSPRFSSWACRPVLKLLRRRKDLAQEFWDLVKSSGNSGAVRALMEATKQDAGLACTADVLAAYCDKLMASKERPSPATLSAYCTLVRSLTLEDVGSKVLPALSRALRRVPEVAMTILFSFASESELDLSAHAQELLSIVMQQLRTKESVRPLATECVRAVVKRMKDPEALATLAASVLSILDGSAEGKVKAPVERAAMMGALSAMAPGGASVGRPSASSSVQQAEVLGQLASRVCTFLSGFYKEEMNEEVRLAILSCLPLWLPHCSSPPDAATLGLLSACFKDPKESLRKAGLRAAAATMLAASKGAAVTPALAAALAEPAARAVAEALAKPALRSEGVVALLIAAAAAAADPAADALLDKEKLWASAAVKGDSPFLSVATSVRLLPLDCVQAARMCGALLSSHQGRLAAHPGAVDATCRLLTALMVHYSKEVRREAGAAAATTVAAAPALLGPLCDALRLMMRGGAGTAAPLLPPDAEPDAALAPPQLSGRFSTALLALVPVSSAGQAPLDPDAGQLTALLLAAHHPVVTTALRHRSAVWQAVCHKSPAVAKVLPGRVEAVVSSLCGELGLLSAERSDVVSAQLSLGSLMTLCPNVAFPHIHAQLEKLLDRSSYLAISPQDMEVFQTAEGMLASERAQEGVYVGEVVQRRNVKKAKGRYRDGSRAFVDDDDDDDDDDVAAPAPMARRPSAPAPAPGAKPGAKDAAARQAEARQRKLEEESGTRARVRGVQARLELGLAALACCVVGNRGFASKHLEELQALCMPYLSSQLVGGAAFEAVRLLGSCLPGRLGRKALALASSLRLVVMAQTGDNMGMSLRDLPRSAPVAEVVHALRDVTNQKHRSLAAPSYRFVFPVLRAVLSSPSHTPQHDEALAVLALHCAPGEDMPRRESLELLYNTLGVLPAYRDRILPLLKSLCSGASEDELPAAVKGVMSGQPHVRAAALAALPSVPLLGEGHPPPHDEQTVQLYIARFDSHEPNVAPANALWELAHCQLPSSYLPALLNNLGSEFVGIRTAAAAALASAIQEHPGSAGDVVAKVISFYTDAPLDSRLGVAAALLSTAASLGHAEVTAALDFLIRYGLADHDDKVREVMVTAGTAIVDSHGGSLAQHMLPIFEGFLEKNSGMSHGEESRYDLVREGVIVFLGTLARHLPPEDPKRSAIIETLISVLGTPSESVQRSVSTCLPPLIQALSSQREYIESLVSRLMNTLTKGSSFGDRRGAAFGLSGLVKGLGIMAMKNYNIMDSLKAAVEDKKEATAREGALLAFECLSEKLGKLFEPYIIYILPLLLNCFGDVVPLVRQATEDASRMIMGQLTASGVKLVLPALLKGLEDKVWRTKQGSVQLLGAMAHCAPKQLGSCLPTIVPRLGDVLGDPHPKVQAAAQEALNEIGSVIRNPEVQTLVPHLLAAIAEPNARTRLCLDVLLETVFVNTIDAPSLALIVPVVYRGLRDRMGDTKRRAARIVGNMCTLINDPKDMTPYVPLLMPELQKSLVDPLPEVRAVSARAMGSLVKGMGSETFSDLVPWLMETLRSDGSSVERSGAAQGLAEILSVLGTSHMEAILPDVLDGCKHRVAHIREGHLTLFQFLPITLETQFQPYLGRVLPSILDGLADESEGVRDAALSAGRVFVDHYANSALTLILPAVEDGIFQDNWRIRQSSVLLMGKLLFKVVGTSGNIVVDGGSDDEGAAEEHYGEAIIAALGMERRNQVLSRLYVTRSDPQYSVRSEALHVWKTIVVNTPKTLLQLLPVLMRQVITALASASEDRRTMAARCMGELCRKMGEKVLARIIPILKEGIKSPEGATRQGVCLGLKEVLENISKHQLAEHLGDVLSTVQCALTDSEASVREAAGEAFAILFKGGAGSAVESVVPSMIAGLESEKHFAESLEGLRVIQLVRPSIFNFVVPKLLRMPLQLHNIRALAVLTTSAGHTLNAHIGTALPKLLTLASHTAGSSSSSSAQAEGLEGAEAGSKEAAAGEAAAAIALAVQEDGLHLLVAEMLHGLEDPLRRCGTAELVRHFASRSRLEFQDKVPTLLDAVVVLLGEEDPATLQALWKAMEALAATIPKEEHHQYVRPLKEAVATAAEKERRKRRALVAAARTSAEAAAAAAVPLLVAGFSLPKALAPILPIYLAGVLQGSSTEVREQAAEGLGELVDVTGEEALRPFVVPITGPLIRIIGDRFPSQVKAAILLTLGLLIRKAGPGLKPFVPQLQTTFLKCLTDPSDVVRQRAAQDLGQLSRMSVRVDQLATDLVASARTAEFLVRDSYLHALQGLLLHSGERVSAAVISSLGDALRDLLRPAAAAPEGEEGDGFRAALASCLGVHAKHGGAEQLQASLTAGPLGSGGRGGDNERLLHAMVLAACMSHAGALVSGAGLMRGVGEAMQRYAKDPSGLVRTAAGRTAARLATADASILQGGLSILVALLAPDQSSGVQQQALLSLDKLAEANVQALEPHLSAFMPSLCALMGTTAGPTKQACERTVKHVLQLDESLEVAQTYLETGPGPSVRTALTDTTLRRLQKLPEDPDFYTLEDY